VEESRSTNLEGIEEMEEFHIFKKLKVGELGVDILVKERGKFKEKRHGYKRLGKTERTCIELTTTINTPLPDYNSFQTRLITLFMMFISFFKQKTDIKAHEKIQAVIRVDKITENKKEVPHNKNHDILKCHDSCCVAFENFNILRFVSKIPFISWFKDFESAETCLHMSLKIQSFKSIYDKLTIQQLNEIVKKSKFIVKIQGNEFSLARAIIVGLSRINKLHILTNKLTKEKKSDILRNFRSNGSTKKNLEGAYRVIKLNKCNIQINLAKSLYEICKVSMNEQDEIEEIKDFEKELGVHIHLLDGNEQFKLVYPVTWHKNKNESIFLLKSRTEKQEINYNVIIRDIERFQ